MTTLQPTPGGVHKVPPPAGATAPSAVPFLDLRAQYLTIKEEIRAGIDGVLESGQYAGGPFVERFEAAFSAFCGTEHAVGVGNGTEALWAALLAVGVRPGDEVITVPNTFMATAEAITFAGARPVFVDIDPRTYNLDTELLEAAITPRTRAIVPVHLYGQMADMAPIVEIGRRRGIAVVEDASQAHGADYRGRRAGSLGDVGCFSFYPGTNLGAYGEAGAVVTNNADLARTIRMFRDHGQERKYHHALVGFNARMDGFQGAVLSAKLPHLPAWTAARRRHAAAYTLALQDAPGITTPFEAGYGSAVYHIYAVLVPDRDAVLAALGAGGVHCAIHYPVPLHLQEAYRELGYRRGDFPVAERMARETLSLPMYAELTEGQRARVVERLRSVVTRGLS
jgi:dTDP-4-amino-4,6-dideoxygalactose transaminase